MHELGSIDQMEIEVDQIDFALNRLNRVQGSPALRRLPARNDPACRLPPRASSSCPPASWLTDTPSRDRADRPVAWSRVASPAGARRACRFGVAIAVRPHDRGSAWRGVCGETDATRCWLPGLTSRPLRRSSGSLSTDLSDGGTVLDVATSHARLVPRGVLHGHPCARRVPRIVPQRQPVVLHAAGCRRGSHGVRPRAVRTPATHDGAVGLQRCRLVGVAGRSAARDVVVTHPVWCWSVIAPLTPVSDERSVALMTRLHRELAAGTRSRRRPSPAWPRSYGELDAHGVGVRRDRVVIVTTADRCRTDCGDGRVSAWVSGTLEVHAGRPPPRWRPAERLRCGFVEPAELLAWVGEGDESAWNELVDQFAGLVWSVARSFRLGKAATDDVVQTVWLRLAEHSSRIRQPERLASWLATTTRNESLRVISTSRPARAEEPYESSDPTSPSVDDRVVDLDDRDRVMAAFELLTEDDQRFLLTAVCSPPPSTTRRSPRSSVDRSAASGPPGHAASSASAG